MGLILLTPLIHAQSITVTSHYPASAYVVNRLLPFVLNGDDEAVVTRVDTDTGHCLSLIDPFYPNTFHIYCKKPVVVDLRVQVRNSAGEEVVLDIVLLGIIAAYSTVAFHETSAATLLSHI